MIRVGQDEGVTDERVDESQGENRPPTEDGEERLKKSTVTI